VNGAAGTVGNPLRVRAFRRVFAAQAISVSGSALSPVALTLGVLDATRSRADLSLVLAANTVPMVVFLLFGHALAARVPLLRLSVWGNAIAAVSQGTLGALFLAGPYSTAVTVGLQCVTGAAVAAYLPTILGITTGTVPTGMLQRANGLISAARSFALSVGPTAAGVIVAFAGPGWALLADGLSFAVSALILADVRLTPGPQAAPDAADEDQPTFAQRLLGGIREVTRRSWVWSSIGFFAAAQFATAVFLVLGPSLVALQPDGSTRWGLIVSASGIGQLVGDLLSLRLRPRRPLLAARLMGILAVPVLLVLAWGAPLAGVAACAVLAGLAVTMPDTLWFTTLQQRLPPAALRTVSAYDWMVSLGLRPVGFLCAAAFAGWLGVTATFLLAAALVAAAALAGLAVTEVRTMGTLTDHADQ
jgi:predicted MFS family arabinose efflux permease